MRAASAVVVELGDILVVCTGWRRCLVFACVLGGLVTLTIWKLHLSGPQDVSLAYMCVLWDALTPRIVSEAMT